MCQAMNVGGGIRVLNSIPCGSQAVVYSAYVDTSFVKYFGLWIKSETASAALLSQFKVQWQGGRDKPTDQSIPGAADANFTIPTGMADIASVSAAGGMNWALYDVNPPPSGLGRVVITGQTSNAASNNVWAELWMQG